MDRSFDECRDLDYNHYTMRLIDYLDENLIFLNLEANDKNDAFEKIVALIKQKQALQNFRGFLVELRRRESLGRTAINDVIAHAPCPP